MLSKRVSSVSTRRQCYSLELRRIAKVQKPPVLHVLGEQLEWEVGDLEEQTVGAGHQRRYLSGGSELERLA